MSTAQLLTCLAWTPLPVSPAASLSVAAPAVAAPPQATPAAAAPAAAGLAAASLAVVALVPRLRSLGAGMHGVEVGSFARAVAVGFRVMAMRFRLDLSRFWK